MLSFPKLLYNMINSNQNLELFSDYFIQNKLNRESFLTNLQNYPKRTFNHIKKSIPNIIDIIESLENYSYYDKFFVVGCPLSTDIDVICIVQKQYILNSVPLPLKNTEIIRLSSELESIGYSVERQIDYNLICIENKRCVGKSKGGEETINILLKTHSLHKQKYEFDIQIDLIEVLLIDKLKAITKFIFDYIEDATTAEKYREFRETKRRLYMEGIDSMIKYVHILLDMINFNENKNNRDFFKSLTMKIIQLNLLQDNIYIYTKEELITSSEAYGFDKENVRYFLTRGKNGNFDINTFRKLSESFVRIRDEYYSNLNVQILQINSICNQTLLSDTLFNEFIKSPNSHTNTFQIEYEKSYTTGNINELFPIEPTPLESIDLPESILKRHFIQIPQRSQEWVELIGTYRCGSNNAEIKNTMEGTYNLLRGAITESIILNNFNPELLGFDGWTKVNVGMLVENIENYNSIGCSPDLLLVKDHKIISIEIKTLPDSNHNNNYYKKLDLARKQLQTIENILGKDIIYKNIVIMAYWTDTLNIECNIY